MGSTNQETKARNSMKANIEGSEEPTENNSKMEKDDKEYLKTPQKKTTAKIDIAGANSRVRTNSECSTGSPKSPSVTSPKKLSIMV